MRRPAEVAVPGGTLPPWGVAALVHVACTAVMAILAVRAPVSMPAPHWTWCEGLLAALGGGLAGLPPWWLPINFFFAPALHTLLACDVPVMVYFGAFCTLYAFNSGVLRHRVPLFMSSALVVPALRGVLPGQARFRLLDVGCGDGSVLAALARTRPDGLYRGIEISPLSCVIAWLRNRMQSAIEVNWGNFWREDFGQYDVVYAYLSPVPMAQLWEKARREMRAGSLLVSNTFAVPGIAPALTLPVGDRLRSTVYVWRF